LIIDPTVVYATSLTGEDNYGSAAIAVDDQGDAYVTGAASHSFPTVDPIPGGSIYQAGTCPPAALTAGCDHAFVAKLDPSGRTLLYRTYLGGTSDDFGNGIAVDRSGNAYVTGSTASKDFPTVNALQPAYGGGDDDVFVSKISPTGNTLVYSTYLSGTGDEGGDGIAVDSLGQAYVTGTTSSADFPTVNAFQPTLFPSPGFVSPQHAFVLKLAASGTSLIYSTSLGETGFDQGGSIAVDGLGDAYVAGDTTAGDFPQTEPVQSRIGFGGYLVKLAPSGNTALYSTYLGPRETHGIAVDSAGSAYVAGLSGQAFPFVSSPPEEGSCTCMFIIKVAAPLPAAPTPTATPIAPTPSSTGTATATPPATATPTISPTATSTVPSTPSAERVTLTAGDMPSGFHQTSPGPISAAAFAHDFGVSLSEATEITACGVGRNPLQPRLCLFSPDTKRMVANAGRFLASSPDGWSSRRHVWGKWRWRVLQLPTRRSLWGTRRPLLRPYVIRQVGGIACWVATYRS